MIKEWCKNCLCISLYRFTPIDLVPLQSQFFPPNFSFIFWKRKFWREKIYSSKECIYFANEVFPSPILTILLKYSRIWRVRKFVLEKSSFIFVFDLTVIDLITLESMIQINQIRCHQILISIRYFPLMGLFKSAKKIYVK